jgi:uncharacterized protein YigA (DUF484 family)
MSKKLPSEELSWEQAVSRYLEENPEYFEHRPDILAAMRLRHVGRGKAVSLIERQVQVLRDRSLASQQQLRELVTVARENDILSERLHRFAVAMVDSASLDDVLDTAKDMLRQEFKLDAVVVLLNAQTDDHRGRPEFIAGDKEFQALIKQCRTKGPVCGGRHTAETMAYLFSELRSEIKSTALIALKDPVRDGLLCMGSRDPHRFHPEMGTVYLTRLGELLMRGVARYLHA